MEFALDSPPNTHKSNESSNQSDRQNFLQDGEYRNNVVELEIPQKAADIIREAWTCNEMPQGQSCNAKYLATNQNASVALEVDEEVVAGINGMCQQETQEDAFYRMYIDED